MITQPLLVSAVLSNFSRQMTVCFTGKNGFVTAAKLGTTDNFFVAATKIFAAATKRFVDRIKHFVVVTKCFCYPYLKKNISLV